MNRYYTRTFVGMAVVLISTGLAAFIANSAAHEAKLRRERLLLADHAERGARAEQRSKTDDLRRAMEPVQAFAGAWNSLAFLPEKEAAERVRSDLESIAQRQLGLVTDNAITPQPDRFTFQGRSLRVQRVTLRASGKDLAALLSWLGKVEERYPAALVEGCDFVSNVGGNTGLSLRLVQPLHESPSTRHVGLATSPEAFAPEAIAALAWARYHPTKLKAPVATGFARNPLQPAVVADHRPSVGSPGAAEEITPRLEMALDGRLRSVIRGHEPIIVVDGRVIRIGDELTLGPARERPLPEAKTKLKQVMTDRLVFHVAGGTAEKPIQCDVAYALPAFLKAR